MNSSSTSRLLATLSMFLATGLFASPPDVRSGHWAASAVDKVVDGGYMGKAGQPFRGNRQVNRYEAADSVSRLLDSQNKSAFRGVAIPAGLRKLNEDFAADVPVTKKRVEQLEHEVVALSGQVDRLKAGRPRSFDSAPARMSFGGILSAGFVSTDHGGPVINPPFRTRYTGSSGQEFFTLPRASVTLDHHLNQDLRFFLQADYVTDVASRGLLGAGNNVGLSEAYIERQLSDDRWSLRLGAFASNFASWEVDGPARTVTRTISPSVVNTFFESLRFVGVQGQTNVGGADVRVAVFNGADLGIGATPPNLLGNISDATGLGQVLRTASRDDRFGFYLDVERQIAHGLQARVGYVDLGGDPGRTAPKISTVDLTGFHYGLRFSCRDWEIVLQGLELESDIASTVGIRGENSGVSASVTRRIRKRDSLTLRWDDWENEVKVLTNRGTEGDAWTLAWTREYENGSRLQWEWLTPVEQLIGGGSTDAQDDQFQMRYTVSF